ncbi:MAG: bifunctional DNA primase/polymerase [Pirellulales bacterium]
MHSMLEAALAYAEMGYPAFPCANQEDPAPLTEHGFKDAVTDLDQIERWWARHPHACIGLATAGLVVIDIDGPANPWLADRPDLRLQLMAAPTSLTPGGGRHHIFRQPADRSWSCTTSRLAECVDTRANGGYIVVPPSRRSDGSYRWIDDCELVAPDRLPEPPTWLVAMLDSLSTDRSGPGSSTTPALGGNPIPSGQRNSTLASLAGTMRRVGMGHAEILAALERTNADRCSPPLPQREVERIARNIARYEPDQLSVAIAENHWDQVFAEPDPEPETPAVHDPGPTPEHLLRVPGFVSEVMDYTLRSAPYPEPSLAFCGAMALQAVLAGRKVRDESDNRTTLYLLGLANSGAGKDFPRKVNQRILVHVGMGDCLGDSFASGEGIEDRLFLSPSVLFQTDEIDGMMTKINQAKDARHESIMNVLLKMYSSTNAVYPMRVKAGKEHGVIDQPCLCVFGTAIPQHYYEALSLKMLSNGFFARMLVLEAGKRRRGQDAKATELPESVLKAAEWWADFRPGSTGNFEKWHPRPRVVGDTAEAADVLRRLRERGDEEYAFAEGRDDQIGMAIWARAYEKARRLALVYACSANREQPIVTVEAAQWAADFVAHQTRRMLFMAGSHVSRNDFDAMAKEMVRVLRAWRDRKGDQPMPEWELSRRLPWKPSDHCEVVRLLRTQRLVECAPSPSKTRPGTIYWLLGT